MSVSFHQQTTVTLSQRNHLKLFIAKLFAMENKRMATLDIIFCTDDYLLEVNRSFLQHDYYTDIITFDLSDNKKAPTIGELYISVDRVKDNATTLKTSFKNELHRVIFHGCLHLCGYKDKTPKAERLMRLKEEEYLDLYF
ncbi:rRNA maturation RNase YbeY [Ferruginibacter yonginensis]|uniref:Endoribonuclease YbeY n=1 Tax=Ferruginibacter yonginensis TaxID=1310416 RepID=A0ABV8QTI2_9BACT